MDLFSTMDENYMKETKEQLGSWGDLFDSTMLEHVDKLLEKVNDERGHRNVYPPQDQILRLYRDLPLKDIRVVIIGQDPYPNANANGYAFACADRISPTITMMIGAMKEDLNTIPSGIGNMKLEHLVEQGVFLFNTILTVTDESMAHENYGWQEFTAKTIEMINQQNRPIVWMLWGDKAKRNEKLITNRRHLVLKSNHPVAAHRARTKWRCNHFSRCNDFLQREGIEKIQWL